MSVDIKRISNECSEELIHRHNPNSLMDTFVPAFFFNQIINSVSGGHSPFKAIRKMGGSSQFSGQELEDLKHQADSLNKKMKEVISRIK